MTFNGRTVKEEILLTSSVGKGCFVNFRPLGFDSLNRRIKVSRPFLPVQNYAKTFRATT